MVDKKTPSQKAPPLLLRFHRLIEAFSKSDDERDFYLDTKEGFLIYIDLDKEEEALQLIEKEIKESARFLLIPKLTFYETKKFMEGFVHEKVFDIDVKEKLLDIIQSREPRENFLEFIYDHLTELDKWQQYYHERSRVRIIEWLRKHDLSFVFEEDLDFLPKITVEKFKVSFFDTKVSKEIQSARHAIEKKAETYYSSEALNPRPKRGRPPKQAEKIKVEPQFVDDYFSTVNSAIRPFLFTPEYCGNAVTFSTEFDDGNVKASLMKGNTKKQVDTRLEMLSQRLESLRMISGSLETMKTQLSDADQQISDVLSHGFKGKEVSSSSEPSGVSKLASGILPSQNKKETERKKKTIKTVTPISYKGKKHNK